MKKEVNLILTAEGYLELEEELNELKTVRRPEVINAIKDARAQGDLSENADYDAARAEQAQIEARIKELEYRLEHSTIAEAAEKGGCEAPGHGLRRGVAAGERTAVSAAVFHHE